MLIYATREDLGEWLNPVPDEQNAKALLREASALVRKATRADRYEPTPAGMPADAFIRDAFRDATCAQVSEWVTAELDPVAGLAGQELQEVASSIAGGSVTLDASGQAEARARALTELCPRGVDILRNEGLGNAHPAVY
ncbi:hypothetical protein GS504_15645 [Rhodococcus hoagii]|nr:hypothetical protein [Prescottella equi]